MTYTWTTFNLDDALAGTLVGFQQSDGTTTIDYDISKTGRLLKGPGYTDFNVNINGIKLIVDKDGNVLATNPYYEPWSPVTTGEGEQAETTYKQLQMVTTEMGDVGSVGGKATRTRGSTSGQSGPTDVTITSMEPRDQFAVRAMQTMMERIDHPEALDDASMLMYAYASYKWAQAMVLAMADSRNTDAPSGGSTPSGSVNPGDLQTNTEKLLYDMNQLLKDGVAIRGSEDPLDKPVLISGESISTPDTNVTIEVSVVNKKCVKFEFLRLYAASDLSIFVTLTCKVGETAGVSRSAGFVIPKGSTVFVGSVDPDITEITALSSPTLRGKGSSLDSYTYMMSLAT